MSMLFVSLILDLTPFNQQNLFMAILLCLKFKAYLLVFVLSTFGNPIPSVGAEKL